MKKAASIILISLIGVYFLLIGVLYEWNTDLVSPDIRIVKVTEVESGNFTSYSFNTRFKVDDSELGWLYTDPKYHQGGQYPNKIEVGSEFVVHLDGFGAHSWMDLLKLFWAKYDYEVVKYALEETSQPDKTETLLQSEKDQAELSTTGIIWAVVVLIVILVLRYIIQKAAFSKGVEKEGMVVFNKPAWLEIFNSTMALLVSAVFFAGGIFYFTTNALWPAFLLTASGLLPFILIYKEFKNRSNEIRIDNNSITVSKSGKLKKYDLEKVDEIKVTSKYNTNSRNHEIKIHLIKSILEQEEKDAEDLPGRSKKVSNEEKEIIDLNDLNLDKFYEAIKDQLKKMFPEKLKN